MPPDRHPEPGLRLAAQYMPADRSAAPMPPSDGTDADDADHQRFVFGADPRRERWWGRPLAETRWCLELGRLLAARRPDRVSHAISMGADLQDMFGASTPTLFCVRVARRAVHAGGRARRDMCLSAHCGCRFSHDYGRVFPFDPVRLTSIYSKGDGVVHWQCQVISHADCVEVTGGHVGLIFNRKAYRAVASASALPELSTTTRRCQS
jgi:hypothetical protein